MHANLPPLPIDSVLEKLREALNRRRVAVLQAEPGAGKTTRVPLALLDDQPGEIWIAEPRRMAALLAAKHVAEEIREQAGQTIGYRVRLDEKVGPQTRIVYVTDGILLRRLLADPELRGVHTVILDEFHERRLHSDLLAALLKKLLKTRQDLRLLVMSATLDTQAVAQWLEDAPVILATGRTFPVEIAHAATLDHRPLEEQVATAVRQLLEQNLLGDVLVFLPGAAEIRHCERALQGLAARHDLVLRPLHGSLTLDEQERAIRAEKQRKIVLATNIAETSLTLPRVVAVIDTGLARVAKHATWSGIPSLQLARISQASATQRAGRAGRVQAGQCVRLYTKHDHDTRPQFDIPEILRADLAEALLVLAHLRVQPEPQFWLTPPEPAQVTQALELLRDLGALAGQSLTSLGQQMVQLPLPPRLARLAMEAAQRGVGEQGAQLAAMLADGHNAPTTADGDSDVIALVAQAQNGSPAMRQIQQISRQILKQLPKVTAAQHPHDALALAVLTAFGDRVAKRRQPGSVDVELAGGRTAKLDARAQLTAPEWLVAVDLDERRDGKGATTLVRLAQGIEPSWLLELFGDQVQAETRLMWHPGRARVLAEERLTYRGLVLDASVVPAKAGVETGKILQQAVENLGVGQILDVDALERLKMRMEFARPLLEIPQMSPLLTEALAEVCSVATTLAEVRDANVLQVVREKLRPQLAKLDQLAPETTTLPGGRKVKIHYETGQPPWVESRLQDFFGQADGPRLLNGTVPVVLHLLAPNQRPVQLTSDLAGFWTRHYPGVKKELQRRYPRHAWPDDPLHAEPSQPKPRR